MLVVSPILASLVCALIVLLIASVFYSNRRVVKQSKESFGFVQGLEREVIALNHASVGVGRKAMELEKKLAQVSARLDEMRNNDPANVSYSEAARLVELGASVEDLMNACGISRPEAELVSALTHSKGEAANAPQPAEDDAAIPTLRIEA